MSEMVERVARAMSKCEPNDTTRRIARLAIEAMREPTEAMIGACDINIPTEGEIIGIWTSMIDAAYDAKYLHRDDK